MQGKIYPRIVLVQLLKWMNRREAYAIKGPRQSGKTTVLKILEKELQKKKKNTVFLNFEDPDVLEAFEKSPKEYIESFLSKQGRYYILIDEYHYAKEPGKKLKLLFDTFENVKFIVTGSSSLELSGAMAKFLVGRVFFFELFPFSFYEFLVARNPRLARIYEERNRKIKNFLSEGKAIEIKEDIFHKEFVPLFNEYLTIGGYPAVLSAKDSETKKTVLKNIYDTYISKDIVEFLKISDAFKYRTVVRTLSILIGNLINYNEICSTSQSYFNEVKRIISILSETYVINLIHPYHKNPITEIKKVPKIYFLDLGLRNYIVDNFNEVEKRTDGGAMIENFAFLGLRNMFPDKAINYWRTIAKAEVDFVVRFNDETIPIEIKYRRLEQPKISRSFRSFVETYKPDRALIATKDFWARTKMGKTTILFVPVCYL